MLLPREVLSTVLPATTDNDTRYFLKAVQVSPDGTCTATDGHILIRAKARFMFPDEDFPLVDGVNGGDNLKAPVLVDCELCERLIAATKQKRRSSLPVLGSVQVLQTVDGESVTLAATDLQVPTVVKVPAKSDQTFPNVERVWPKVDRESVELVLAVDVLEALLKSAKAASGNAKRTPRLRFHVPIGENDRRNGTGCVTSAVLVDLSTDSSDPVEATALAMPCVL